MRILLVEDHAADAIAMAEALRAGGHEVAVSRHGDDTLGQYARHQSDLVIVSEPATGSDGVALAQAILKDAAPRWQPVILVTETCEAGRWMLAMESGCDACLLKPVPLRTLEARLQLVSHKIKMHAEAAMRLARIGEYLAAEEEDLQLARHLIERQMSPDGDHQIETHAVQHWHRACRKLAGDMLAVARGPDGVLHVMLADACGRGLAAYASLLPIIAPFRRMTEKGFLPGTIARELNRHVRQMLPAGRGVAVQLVAVNGREGTVSLWNGGMPAAFMLDAQGQHVQEFPLCHPPLGEVDDAMFDERIAQHAFNRGEQLVMFSDGLVAARDSAGNRFGGQGLAQAMVGMPRGQRRAAVVQAVEAHLAGTLPADDMTLVLIDCIPELEAQARQPVDVARFAAMDNWSFELRLGAGELKRADVVPLLLSVVGQFAGPYAGGGELFVVLSELYNNALDHGLLRLDSHLKASSDGMENWLMLRAERLAALASGEITLTVEQQVQPAGVFMSIRCRDSGPGFDIRAALARLEETDDAANAGTMPFGRGLLLIKRMAERIEFSSLGNDVTVILAARG